MPHTPEPGWCTRAKVVNVVDGDTLDVEITRTIRIRIRDCWAPESRTRDPEEKRRGIAAKTFLVGMAQGHPAIVFIPSAADGKFQDILTMGRFLGDVYLQGETMQHAEGESVAEVMVAKGFATKTKEG